MAFSCRAAVTVVTLTLGCLGCPRGDTEAPSGAASTPSTKSVAEAGQPITGQHPYVFERTLTRSVRAPYLLYFPESYGSDERLWPLLVHLHGGGGRGSDLSALEHYPMVQRLEKEPDFPFVVVSPQCPWGDVELGGETWSEHADVVAALIQDLIDRYAIDPDRVYLIGHSMGGYGTWYIAHRYPRLFAAIAPMCGPAVIWWAYRARNIPTWVWHGALDDAVPVSESEKMVAFLRELGADVRFTRIEDGIHPIREPFDGDELFDWLLEQRRTE